MRPIFSVLAILAGLLVSGAPARALPPPDKDPWIELRTPSFVLFSDAGEKNARRVAEKLERLRSVLGQLNPGLKLTSPNPTYVFVFRSNDAFKPYRRIYNGRPVDVGGYFLTRAEANWVAVNGDPRGDEEAIINHEYLHYILRNNYPSLPLWFNEGMAEVYSSFEATDRAARIGIPIPEHVYWLRRHPLIPPAQLFAMDQGSPDYNEGDRRGVFYAESWALVHYLLVGSPEHRRQAPLYLQEMAREQPAPDAFRRAFGLDDAALEKEIRAYVGKSLFEVQLAPVQADGDAATELHATRRDLPRAEALARLGSLLLSLDPSLWPAAAEHFHAALALDAGQPQALAGLGWLASLGGRPQEALPWLEKASRKAPDDFVIQYLYGLALLEDKPGPADLRQARDAFARAVALQPEFGEAWARLAFAQAQEDPIPAEAVRSFETAHRLLPTHTDIAYNLVLAYARTGQRERAEEVIDHVLAVHGKPDEVQRARAAVVQEQRRDAEELIGQGELEQAAALLERLVAQSPTLEQKTDLVSRLDDVRHVLEYNRFVGRYNQAMELAGRDPKGAIAILEELVATTREPGQLEQAKKVLESLKAERRR
jgi:tetratricopeptide (TPR) repeat protein